MLDVRCFDDLDLFAAEITDPQEQLEQDNYHRMIEPPGSNIDDTERGLGLEDMLGGELDPSIGPVTEAELRKDTRNASVRATVTDVGQGPPQAGAKIRIDLAIETDEGEMLEQSVLAGASGVRGGD